MRRWITIIVLAAVAGLLGWRIAVRVREQRQATGGGPRRAGGPVPVEVAPVRVEPMTDVRTFTGTLRADSEFTLAPKIAGRLEALAVHIGDRLTNGQLVARLDDAEYAQQVAQARAELDVVRARTGQCRTRLALAEREFRRVEELRDKKIASVAELDTAESEYKTNLAELEVLLAQQAQMEAARRAAEVRLGYTRIHAAWEDGAGPRYVGERFVDEGQMLTPNAPILSVVDIRVLQAVVYVIERDYPLIRAGQAAAVLTDAYPGEPFAGEVLRVAKVLRENSRQAQVEVRVPNDDLRLRPGMFVRVRVELGRREAAVTVPRAALVQHKERDGVFLLGADRQSVQFVPVRAGIETADRVEVLAPPLDGEVVILGQHLLRDGVAVSVVTHATGGGAAGGNGGPGPGG